MRDLYGSVLPDFLRLRSTLPKEQLESANALLLFCAYYMSGESCGPMRTMLGASQFHVGHEISAHRGERPLPRSSDGIGVA